MRLLIAGGGTGGHLFPGVALAEELRARDPAAPVLFVGTAKGIEARVLPDLGWELALIEVSGLKTVGPLGALRGLFRLPRALLQARRVVKRFAPDVVIGVGGYASGPVVLMARLMGVKSAILEQNSIPGLANKILGKLVHVVFLAFEETRRYFRRSKIRMTGNPIRRGILLQLTAATGSSSSGAPIDPGAAPAFRVFVFGGSQGARAINELFPAAAARLAGEGVRLAIVHQTGAADHEATRERYAAAGLQAEVHAFIKDMAARYAAADLVVSRSGATTVAELAVVGKPAILIPFPHAADNHQEINAREMADAGAAIMLVQSKLTPELLAEVVGALAREPERVGAMAAAMKGLGRPRAAAEIIDWGAGDAS